MEITGLHKSLLDLKEKGQGFLQVYGKDGKMDLPWTNS